MQVRVDDVATNIVKVALSGRLDIEGSSLAEAKFNPAAEAGKSLIIDLSEVSFLASMGLRTLMSWARAITASGGKAVLCTPQKPVESVLVTNGMHDIIPLHASYEEALAALAG